MPFLTYFSPVPVPSIAHYTLQLRSQFALMRERLGGARELNAATVTLVTYADPLREHAQRLTTLTKELRSYRAAVEASHKRLVLLLDLPLSRGGLKQA